MSTKNDRTNASADVGMIGLAVMGSNMALNMADHGFRVACWNLETDVMQRFVAEHPDTPGGLVGCESLEALVRALAPPRLIVMMIKSGKPVDIVAEQLRPLLDEGDVIVDGGNSNWNDTIRRERELAEHGIHFVGSGVSGGETGARFGPSLMPGGSRHAWKRLRPVWRAIAARVDAKTGRPLEGAEPGRPVKGGVPCTTYVGADGAGHYVKMVHNGIEYADMQLIAEAYHLLRELLGLRPDEIADVFADWNAGELDSFLIEITADLLRQRDPRNRRRFLIDVILDAAGQKGTGKWTAIDALDKGVGAATIAEAVFARVVSSFKERRVAAAKVLRGPKRPARKPGKRATIEAVRDALYASKICCYAQGFDLLNEARDEYGWKLDFGAIASIWRGGCIIRARFLQKITEAYEREKKLENLLLDPYFKRTIRRLQPAWRETVALAARHGVPAPAFMSALAYYDSMRTARLPASVIQAQRDYFGSHTYERTDEKRGRRFHLDWTDPERSERRR